MSKYSKHLVDSVYVALKDEKLKIIPGELENAIIDTLVPNSKDRPKNWNSPSFSPCHNVEDAFSLLNVVYPKKKFELKYCEKEDVYECFVEDEGYSIFTNTPEKSIVLAIWNAHNFDKSCS